MASQCEPPFVWGSALTMRVQGFSIERDDGNKSEGKHTGKMLRHAEYTESEGCPLEIGRDLAREIYQ